MSSTTLSPEYISQIITEANQLNAVKYFLLACFTMLLYDIALTLPEEVEHVWKPKKTVVSYLYFLNRYLNPCYYIVTMTSFFDPSWTTYFVRFEGAATCASYAVVDILLILRVHALWQNIWLACALGVLGLGQVGLWAYALANSGPVLFPPIPQVFRGCILAGNPDFGNRWQLWLFLYIAFDSIVCGLILFKTTRLCRMNKSLIVQALKRDGTAYFMVIFAANLSWLIMAFLAQPAMKNFNAHFSHLISVVLVSRMTLHLRSQGIKRSYNPNTPSTGAKPEQWRHNSSSEGTSVGSDPEGYNVFNMETKRVRIAGVWRSGDIENLGGDLQDTHTDSNPGRVLSSATCCKFEVG